MVFKKNVTYRSYLTIQEIIDNLNSITENYYTNSSDQFKFEGKIDTNSFVILPTFNYGSNAQFRSQILGEITSLDEGTKINLKFNLPTGLKLLMIFALVLNLTIAIPLIIYFSWDFPFGGFGWLILTVLILFFLIAQKYFSFKVNKSLEILKRLLRMK